MAVLFPASLNAKRIAEQMNIFDFQICPEDRKRLDDFFASGGNQQIPSPYK
jgi:diketogulonate reductase-like aldo/keto reductase